MAVVTYKCPNCDGGLIFDAESQKFHCEFCLSYFTEEELIKAGQAKSEEQIVDNAENTNSEDSQESGEDFEGVVYTCPSCGAEVVVDSTKAASQCCFCHNPVVISGRLDGKFKPDCVIPFAIDRDEAIERFLEWTKKQVFAPKNFFSKKQIDKVTGVYFPYWICDCESQAQINATCANRRSWRRGNIEYTETTTYSVTRGGDLSFRDISKNALTKANKALAENVQPFDFSQAKPFIMAYLSGFEAEKRDIESEEIAQQVIQDVEHYSSEILRDTISGYDAVQVTGHGADVNINCRYALVPVWFMTVKNGDKDYFYAMNGQTGNTCGKLPISYLRLMLLFAGTFLATLIILLVIGGLF